MKQSRVWACASLIFPLLLLSVIPAQAELATEAVVSAPVVVLAPADQGEAPRSAESRSPWMDRFHLSTSASLLELSQGLDDFFTVADLNDLEQSNTHLQERLGVQVDTDGRTVILQRLYVRLDLPKTEERLGLFFDQNNDDEDVDEHATPIPRRTATNVRFGTTTGLRFILSRSSWHLVQYRIGATLLPHWQRFSELAGELRFSYGKLLIRPRQLLFWRDHDGLGETTRIDFDYQLAPRTLLRWREQGSLSEASSGFEYLNALYLLHQVGAVVEGKEVLVSLETEGRTDPPGGIVGYLVGVSWRQLLYREWLFIESGCNVTFREERNFQGLPAVFLLLEANFGRGGAAGAPREELPVVPPDAQAPEIIRK